MSAISTQAPQKEVILYGTDGAHLVRLPSVKPLKLRRRDLPPRSVSEQAPSEVVDTTPPKFCYPQKRWPSSGPRSPSTISRDTPIRTFTRSRSESALKVGEDGTALGSPPESSALGHVGESFMGVLLDVKESSSSDHRHEPYIPIVLDTRSTSLPLPDAHSRPRAALASEPTTKSRHAASRSISANRVEFKPAQDRYPVLGGLRASMPVTPSETQAHQRLLVDTVRSNPSLDMARSDSSDDVETPPMTPSKAGSKALQVLGRSEERGGRKPAKWELAKASVERRVRNKAAPSPPEDPAEKQEIATMLAERFAKLGRSSRRKPVPTMDPADMPDVVVIRQPDASDSEDDVFGGKPIELSSSSKAASSKRRPKHTDDVSSDSDRPSGRTSPKSRPPPLSLSPNASSPQAKIRVIQCDTSVTKTPVTPAKRPFVPYAAPRTAPSPPQASRRMAQQPIKPVVVKSLVRKSTVPLEIETQAWTKGQSFFLDDSPTAPTFMSSVTKTWAAKGDRLKRQASQTFEAKARI